ncbi:MAG: AAA family ATPase [Victivallaceae bacterium]|nr:AAA family ATPase [Victivallaceae bacterium]
MSYLIAVSGKGGVGKTTLAGLFVQRLIARKCAPVLAVDADPNMCLDAVLGVHAATTIGAVREEARIIASKGLAVGVSKQELLELKIAESLVEADDFDLIAMGRSEGAGCYCYANNVLKNAINQMSDAYPYVVLDNEAGLENLSRRIVQNVDLMVMVTDPSARGLKTVERLHAMTAEMEIKYDKLAIVINRLRKDELPAASAELKAATNADFIIGLPNCDELAEIAEAGGAIAEISTDNKIVAIVDDLLEQVALPGKKPV